MVRFLLTLLALATYSSDASAQPAAPPPGYPEALLTAMDESDVVAVGGVLTSFLRDEGFDFPDDLSWRPQPFDEPINYYSTLPNAITISAIPSREQTPAYWRAWSHLVTDSTWSAEAFFQDEAEAYRLAAFNQTVIAAHELGHALAFRYLVNPASPGGNVNCQELLADRVAAAVLRQLAVSDERFRDLRARYVELITSFNAHVPMASRYTMESEHTLLTDCYSIHVANPASPAELAPYASAYFERHRLLYGDREPESLRDLADTVFLPRYRAYESTAPPVEGEVEVRTLGTLTDLRQNQTDDLAGWFESLREYDATFDSRAFAIGLDGSVSLLTISSATEEGSDSTRLTIHVADAREGGRLLTSHEATVAGIVRVLEAAAPRDGHVAALVELATLGPAPASSLRLLHLRGSDVRWGEPLAFPVHDAPRLHLLPDGTLTVAHGREVLPVDLDALAVRVGSEIGPPTRYRLDDWVALAPAFAIVDDGASIGQAYVANGRPALHRGGSILLRDGEQPGRIAGSGFESTRDGRDPRQVAFQTVIEAQVMPDGRLLVIEEMHEESNGVYPRDAVVLREAVPADVLRQRGD